MRLTVPILLVPLAAACIPSMKGTSRDEDTRPAVTPPAPAGWVSEVEFPAGVERPAPQREADIVAAVDDLASADFGNRTRGSRALLAYGEPAVPYLGYRTEVSEIPPDPDCPYCILLHAILAKLPASRVAVHLASPYAIVRIGAATAAGERGYANLAPTLAGLLDDPELEVRRAAVTALRRITRKFLGYRAADSPAERADAAEAWRRETGAAAR